MDVARAGRDTDDDSSTRGSAVVRNHAEIKEAWNRLSVLDGNDGAAAMKSSAMSGSGIYGWAAASYD